MPNRAKLSRTGDGFVALGITALAYGLTEMAQGYGFLAVFVAALALRSMERGHHYHEKLHDFAEQLERLLMMIVLVLFGGALADGGLLDALSWEVVAFAVLAIFVVRPVSGWIGLLGARCPPADKAVVSFFGIRGIGSFYYLAYAFGHGQFEDSEVLWSAVSLVVLVSIVLHGITVTPVMRTLDRFAGRTPPGEGEAEADDAEPTRGAARAGGVRANPLPLREGVDAYSAAASGRAPPPSASERSRTRDRSAQNSSKARRFVSSSGSRSR
jgi:NhaP-type Na+/H+ or K+/H+ antiporter